MSSVILLQDFNKKCCRKMGNINAALKYCTWISFFLSTERSLDGDAFGVLSPWYQNFKNQRLHTCQPTHHKFSYLSFSLFRNL